MTAPLRQQQIRIDPVAVFIARAEDRAMLWAAGEMTLHDAVDKLWVAAIRDGLVAKLGQDRVQEITAAAFAAVRDDLLKFEDIEAEPTFADDAWSAPGWCDAAVDYHKDRGDRVSVRPYTADELARLRERMADNVTLERAWQEINHPTDRATASTLEALMFGLRERGAAALAEGPVRQRLVQLERAQVLQVGDRLQRLQAHIANAWTPAEVRQLFTIWGRLRRCRSGRANKSWLK
jgi:hypothetical protein